MVHRLQQSNFRKYNPVFLNVPLLTVPPWADEPLDKMKSRWQRSPGCSLLYIERPQPLVMIASTRLHMYIRHIGQD